MAKFATQCLSKDAMRSIKGGYGGPVFVHFKNYTAVIPGGTTSDDILSEVYTAGANANYFTSSGWCCQNDQGIVWKYKTTEAMASAISGSASNGPSGDNLQCTVGSYCA